MKTFGSFAFLLAVAAIAGAQNPPPGGHRRFDAAGPRFLGAEAGMPHRVVKGAPFSGDLVTESTQTLADGNRIRQTSTVHLFRDSEGRTRREQSLAGLGVLAAGGGEQRVIFLNDPAAGANYALDPVRKTAKRSPWTAPPSGARRAVSSSMCHTAVLRPLKLKSDVPCSQARGSTGGGGASARSLDAETYARAAR